MLIETIESLNQVIENLHQAKIIVVDLETNGLRPYLGDRLIGVALYIPEIEESYYIPFRHGEGFNFDPTYLDCLKWPLSDPYKTFYNWNAKFDQHFLQVDGFPILQRGTIYNDVLIALHLLDENRHDPSDLRGLNYKLKDNGKLFLGVEEGEAEDELKEYLKERTLGKSEMWKLPASMVHKYAEQDVVLTWKLFQFFLPYLEKWNQVDLFYEVAKFNSTILARMENYGVPVNRDLIQVHIQESKLKAAETLKFLQNHYGANFNPNSPAQVSKVLNTPDAKKATLDRLSDPLSQAIVDYKNLTKAEGTFYKPYLYYSAFDNKIHPTFNVTRTNSGRLSSSDPNLQQVPRYSSKYKVKEVFVAPEGYVFANIDFKQQELRLACYFSKQQNMIDLFMQDADLHAYTAKYLFNKEEITKEDRHIGKTANFGFLYGMGKRKASQYLSEQLKRTVTEKEAKKILDAWKELYSNFVRKLQECAEDADRLRGVGKVGDTVAKYFKLEDGRVRHFIKGQRPFTAWNFLIQGTGGTIMRKSLMRIHEAFPMNQDEVIPILSVHDSIGFLIKEEGLDENLLKIKEIMEDFDYYPPMKVDIAIGSNYGQVKEYEIKEMT